MPLFLNCFTNKFNLVADCILQSTSQSPKLPASFLFHISSRRLTLKIVASLFFSYQKVHLLAKTLS